MKSFEEMQKCWKQQKNTEPGAFVLSDTMLTKLIGSGIKKEQKLVWEYCVAAGFWQWLIYSSLIYFIVQFWGDWQFVISCAAVIILYIPFTTMFLRKFRNMRMIKFDKSELQSTNIYDMLKTQYKMLNDFFIFKKRFDWLNVPLCCFIIVMILYKYGAIPSLRENMTVGLIVFVVYAVLFVIAIYNENKKRFKASLEKLEMVIKEMEIE